MFYSRTIRTQYTTKYGFAGEEDPILPQSNKFFTHIFSSETSQLDVQRLFRSDFYTKVLNAVALTHQAKEDDTYLVWTKSPCSGVPPKLTNKWSKSTGFRLKTSLAHIYITNLVYNIVFDIL